MELFEAQANTKRSLSGQTSHRQHVSFFILFDHSKHNKADNYYYNYLSVRTFKTIEKRSKIDQMQPNHSIKIQYFLCIATIRIYKYVCTNSCTMKFFANYQTTHIYVKKFYFIKREQNLSGNGLLEKFLFGKMFFVSFLRYSLKKT